MNSYIYYIINISLNAFITHKIERILLSNVVHTHLLVKNHKRIIQMDIIKQT